MDNEDGREIARIVSAARQGDSAELQAAVRDAEPNSRALAAKELADEPEAREALHAALRELGIEEAPEDA